MNKLAVLTLLCLGCRTEKGTIQPDTLPDETTSTPEIDGDGDGYTTPEDCNDSDASVNPGVTELCDGIDNNCDGQIDEEC